MTSIVCAAPPWRLIAVLFSAALFHDHAGWAISADAPSDLPHVAPSEAPLFPLPESGRRVAVSSAEELTAAVQNAVEGDVILIADGVYRVGRPLIVTNKKNVTLCSATRDPAKVMLLGRGFDRVNRGDDILRIGRCDGLTVACLTFADCHAYGLKVEGENSPRNIHVYNCRFLNIGARGVKGSTAQRTVAAGGSIRWCHFENNRVPPGDWQFGGNYISAIDMMSLEDWTISDNTFVNIKGHSGGGRAAIFVWVRSRRVVVERNHIRNCDLGIALGNPSSSSNYVEGMLHVYDSVCRNNFIVAGPNAGIELAWVDGVRVYNNTIWREDVKGRSIRCIAPVHKVDMANNLVRGALLPAGGETLRNNVIGPMDDWFIDPAAGNLRLRRSVPEAVDRGLALAEVTEDIDGEPRDGKSDLGASEYRGP